MISGIEVSFDTDVSKDVILTTCPDGICNVKEEGGANHVTIKFHSDMKYVSNALKLLEKRLDFNNIYLEQQGKTKYDNIKCVRCKRHLYKFRQLYVASGYQNYHELKKMDNLKIKGQMRTPKQPEYCIDCALELN